MKESFLHKCFDIMLMKQFDVHDEKYIWCQSSILKCAGLITIEAILRLQNYTCQSQAALRFSLDSHLENSHMQKFCCAPTVICRASYGVLCPVLELNWLVLKRPICCLKWWCSLSSIFSFFSPGNILRFEAGVGLVPFTDEQTRSLLSYFKN